MCDAKAVLGGISPLAQAFIGFENAATTEKTAKFNARELENQSQEQINATTIAENAEREKTAQLRERQRVQLAANGVDVNSGTAIKLQEDTTLTGDIDAFRIRDNGLDQAERTQRQAELTLAEGKAAANAQRIGAVSGLVSAAAGGIGGGIGGSSSGVSAPATSVSSKWFTPNSSAFTDFGGSSNLDTRGFS